MPFCESLNEFWAPLHGVVAAHEREEEQEERLGPEVILLPRRCSSSERASEKQPLTSTRQERTLYVFPYASIEDATRININRSPIM